MAALEVSCVAVSQRRAREHYKAQDYEVCLLEDNAVPRGEVEAGEDPGEAALRIVREITGLRGCSAISLAVYDSPQHLTLLYIVPVAPTNTPSSCRPFCTLLSATAASCTDQHHRNLLSSVEQWLQERHALPFLDPSLYFLSGEEGGAGGVVRAVVENPVFLCTPPEDKLVISLNNPTFSADQSTIDLHATQA